MRLEVPEDLRVFAVDWSGAVDGGGSKIWISEAKSGRLLRLEAGYSRTGVCHFLETEAKKGIPLVAGLDFAFSFPRWYLDKRGFRTADELWECSTQEGEAWLKQCEPPFWGRPGRKKPDGPDGLRETDRSIAVARRGHPKSVFQIGGAGAVGTGSVRGMPCLRRLRQAGFSIWPFHAPAFPLIIEIYPRTFTGPIVKGTAEGRIKLPSSIRSCLTEDQARLMEASEDALDAGISALGMERLKGCLGKLSEPSATQLLEGIIWDPEASQQLTC